jgi:carboxyl-terminal processing protease
MNRSSLLIILLTTTFLAGWAPLSWAQDEGKPTKETAAKKSPQETDDETYRQLDLFGEVFERVREQYVDETPDKTLVENAINGMLSSLDPHSGYLNDDGLKDMQVQTRGEFGGLGIEVTQEDGMIKVVTPIDDTPAFRAGIQSGDFITHLDGKPMIGLNLSEAVDQLRGKVGSKITLTIRREGQTQPLKISLVRDTIKIQSVRHRIEDDVGYIRITSFNDNTSNALHKAIEDIRKQRGQKLLGYVLDLRNNPGGLLDQAIEVSDTFLDKGEIVSTRGRNDKDTRRDNATGGDMANGLPIVVLINGGSASAAEIVAGALQDHRRAILLGTQSFGKGSVQTVIPLPSHGAMKLTTARYYTPSGRSIQAKGISPDITVEPAKIEQSEEGDRVKESDLKGALVNPDNDSTPATTPPTEGELQADEAPKKLDAAAEQAKNDYQLQRALDLIRGLSLYTDEAGNIPAHKRAAEEKAASTPDAKAQEEPKKIPTTPTNEK